MTPDKMRERAMGMKILGEVTTTGERWLMTAERCERLESIDKTILLHETVMVACLVQINKSLTEINRQLAKLAGSEEPESEPPPEMSIDRKARLSGLADYLADKGDHEE